MRGADVFFTVLALGGAALVLGRIHSLVGARRYLQLSETQRHALFRRMVHLAWLSAGLGGLLLVGAATGLWDALRAAFTPVGLVLLIFVCLAYALRLRGKADTLGQPRLRPEEVVAAAWIVGGESNFGGHEASGDGSGGA